MPDRSVCARLRRRFPSRPSFTGTNLINGNAYECPLEIRPPSIFRSKRRNNTPHSLEMIVRGRIGTSHYIGWTTCLTCVLCRKYGRHASADSTTTFDKRAGDTIRAVRQQVSPPSPEQESLGVVGEVRLGRFQLGGAQPHYMLANNSIYRQAARAQLPS